MRVRRFERDAAFVMAGTMIANASTYIYHVILSRHLGPASYGALGALLGVAALPAVPSSGLQFALAGRVATADGPSGSAAISGTTRATLQASGVGALVLLLAAWPVASFLRTSVLATMGLALWLPALMVGPVLLGALQGRRLFLWMAASAAILGFGRVFGAIVVQVIDGGVAASVAVMVVAAVASVAIAWMAVKPGLAREPLATAGLLREIVRATVPFVGLAALTGVDVILARRFLTPADAGYYVAAAVAGKIVFWAPASISVVGFAEFARDPTAGHLRRALTAVGVIVGLAVVGVLVLRQQVIGTIFGNEFLPAADVVVIIAVAMGGLALVQVLVTWGLAHRLPGLGATMLAAAGALGALIVARHGSTMEVATDVLAVSSALTATMALRVRRAWLAAVAVRPG